MFLFGAYSISLCEPDLHSAGKRFLLEISTESNRVVRGFDVGRKSVLGHDEV